jgi:hypothetical protein
MSNTSAPPPKGPARQGAASASAPQGQRDQKTPYQVRLENQKSQLERHGNFAEVVIRTTPEGTDLLNFARLWEYVLVQADRQTRGYIAKGTRTDYDATRRDFEDCIAFMAQRLKGAAERHHLDFTGSNFISRIAQRYAVAEKNKNAKAETAGEGAAATPPAPRAVDEVDEVDAL